MYRRLSAFLLVAGVVAAQSGCLSRCGSRTGLFASQSKSSAPCQTVGRNSGCFDAATGQPVPCPPDAPATVIPGDSYPPIGPIPGGTVPPPDQLHMPGPSDLIRPPAVPFPAPPSSDASLPYPTLPGTPVKSGSNK